MTAAPGSVQGGVHDGRRTPLILGTVVLVTLLVLSGRDPYDRPTWLMEVAPVLVVLAFIAISIALAISACYELIEWAAALALGQGADEFLGTQGDAGDAQSDMFFALVGALCAIVALASLQDRQISRLAATRS